MGDPLTSAITNPTPLQAGVGGATLATVAVVGVTFGALYANSKIGDYLAEYNEEESAQIKEIQELYRITCASIESVKLTLSNLETEEEQRDMYPSFFKIELQKRTGSKIGGLFSGDIWLPVKWKNEFSPMFDSKKWVVKVNHGELRSLISEMLAYICQYQTERGEDARHSYSPLHLVFEEFKYWLLKLSYLHIGLYDKEFKQVVEKRIAYLQAIMNSRIFEGKKYLLGLSNKVVEPTPNQTFYSLELKLHSVRDKMTLAISRHSAREHFQSLKVVIEHVLYSSVNYLLYIFSNRKLPKNFILTEVKIPTIPSYKKIINETFLGRILSAFVGTSAYSLVFNLDYFKFELTKYDLAKEKEPYDNSERTFTLEAFIGPDNEIKEPYIKERMDRINKDRKKDQPPVLWYEVLREANIYTQFAQKDDMNWFITLLSWLQKMCFFHKICDSLYELAGEGGNLLVYGKAAARVTAAIASFSTVVDKTEKFMRLINDRAQHHMNFIHSQPNDPRNQVNIEQKEAWQNNFVLIQHEFPLIAQSFDKIKETINNINNKLAEVRSIEYQVKLQKQLNYFNTLVTEFCVVVSDEEHPYVPTKEDAEYFKNFRVEYDTPNASNNNNSTMNFSSGSNASNSPVANNGNLTSSANSKVSNALPKVINNRRTSDAPTRGVVVEEYVAYGEDPNQKKDKKKSNK